MFLVGELDENTHFLCLSRSLSPDPPQPGNPPRTSWGGRDRAVTSGLRCHVVCRAWLAAINDNRKSSDTHWQPWCVPFSFFSLIDTLKHHRIAWNGSNHVLFVMSGRPDSENTPIFRASSSVCWDYPPHQDNHDAPSAAPPGLGSDLLPPGGAEGRRESLFPKFGEDRTTGIVFGQPTNERTNSTHQTISPSIRY